VWSAALGRVECGTGPRGVRHWAKWRAALGRTVDPIDSTRQSACKAHKQTLKHTHKQTLKQTHKHTPGASELRVGACNMQQSALHAAAAVCAACVQRPALHAARGDMHHAAFLATHCATWQHATVSPVAFVQRAVPPCTVEACNGLYSRGTHLCNGYFEGHPSSQAAARTDGL
jgi:hypothetical protein